MVSLLVPKKDKKIKSCYIHVPFCTKICSYCDFCKNYYDEKVVKKYLDALDNEIKTNYKGETLDTLYIGGGTPSCLSLNNLKKLFIILKTFKLSNDYEFTFECNFEDITEELLSFLKENRVNRLSIGIQSFNKKYEKILNRIIDKELMLKKVNLSKTYFDNINVDLMYALPAESINDLKEDLTNIIKLDVTHVSSYALMIEDHTKIKIDKHQELSDDLQSKMYNMIINKLTKSGYSHYELSNFSKEGYESKHNINYWKNGNYYGFGAGASGFINNKRYDNTKSVFNYINGKTMVYEEFLTKEELIKDEVMLNLRIINGINKNDFKRKYGLSFSDAFKYKDLVLKGILKENSKNVFISPDKLFVSNEVILLLLDTYALNK